MNLYPYKASCRGLDPRSVDPEVYGPFTMVRAGDPEEHNYAFAEQSGRDRFVIRYRAIYEAEPRWWGETS